MPTKPSFETLDNLFYISYKIDKENNVVDIYDVTSEKYYNYLNNYDIDLMEIVRNNTIEKYRYDVKILEEERAFLIKSIDSNDEIIIDDNYKRIFI